MLQKKYLVKFNIHSFLALKKVLKVDNYLLNMIVYVCIHTFIHIHRNIYTHIKSEASICLVMKQ